MASVLDPLIAELEQEAKKTRVVLERIPADKIDWKPHDKSMSLGQLGLHVATNPGAIAQLLAADSLNLDDANFTQASPGSVDDLVPALEQSLAAAKDRLSSWDDEAAGAGWSIMRNGKAISTVPRVVMIRSLMLNHWYHHRGQLCVYLRLLDIPVPAVYGPSADESPFAD